MNRNQFTSALAWALPIAALSLSLPQTASAASLVGLHRFTPVKNSVFGLKPSAPSASLAAAAQRATLTGSSTLNGGTLSVNASNAFTASVSKISTGSLALNSGVVFNGGTLLSQTPINSTGLLNVVTSLESADGATQVVTLSNGAVLRLNSNAGTSSTVRLSTGILSLVGNTATPTSAGATAVPEPSVFALAGMSLTGLLALRRRR